MQKRVFLIHGWEGNPRNHWFPWLKLELIARGWEVNAPQMPPGTRIYPSSTAELTTGHGADKERRWMQMPKVKEWLTFLKAYVGKPDRDTYFVGHSLGCIAIARYLAELSAKSFSDSPFSKGRGPLAVRDLKSSVPHFSEKAWDTSPPANRRAGFKKGGIQAGGCVFVAGFSSQLNIPEISEFHLPSQTTARGQTQTETQNDTDIIERAKAHCKKFVMIFSDNDPYVSVQQSLEFAKQLGAKTILERGKGHFCAEDEVTALPSVLQVLVKMSASDV